MAATIAAMFVPGGASAAACDAPPYCGPPQPLYSCGGWRPLAPPCPPACASPCGRGALQRLQNWRSGQLSLRHFGHSQLPSPGPNLLAPPPTPRVCSCADRRAAASTSELIARLARSSCSGKPIMTMTRRPTGVDGSQPLLSMMISHPEVATRRLYSMPPLPMMAASRASSIDTSSRVEPGRICSTLAARASIPCTSCARTSGEAVSPCEKTAPAPPPPPGAAPWTFSLMRSRARTTCSSRPTSTTSFWS
mmetsp:Transcript_41989/g.135005  ORF Transcript_41989/g.135005 Transcript_41989/m.135005 type:complete len:250 (-) Transcript_41989:342-1091(-)